MGSEQNWSGNHTFEAHRIHRPASVDEVRRIVSASAKIHAVGARHSFNGVADSSGDLIDLSGIDPQITVDPDRRTVTVGAAATMVCWLPNFMGLVGPCTIWPRSRTSPSPGPSRPERTDRATGTAPFPRRSRVWKW
jgi:hypothetical protein